MRKIRVGEILGSELTWFFSFGEGSAAAPFTSSADFVTEQIEAPARSKYVIWNVAVSLRLLSLLALLGRILVNYGFAPWPILSGCMGGIVGATISITQRAARLVVNPFVGSSHLIFQGLSRVFLGMIFGGVLVVGSKANVTMGILENNAWSLFIFSIVAGFSERFIPDVLARVANDASK